MIDYKKNKLIIQRMKEAFKVKTDILLAEKLGIKNPSLISQWKTKQGIRLEYIYLTAEKTKKHISWLLGEEDPTANYDLEPTTSGLMIDENGVKQPVSAEPEPSQEEDTVFLKTTFSRKIYKNIENVWTILESKSPIGRELEEAINECFYKWVQEKKEGEDCKKK